MTKHRYLTMGVALAAGLGCGSAALAGTPELAKAAQCAVSADRESAADALGDLGFATTPATLDAARLGKGAKCAAGGLTGPSIDVRGALVEALYKRDFREFGVQPHQSQGNFVQVRLPEGAGDADGRGAVAMCVARSAPNLADRLFGTVPGTQRESDAIAAVVPYFRACRPSGSPLALTRGEMRALIAHGAYETSVRFWAGKMRGINVD